jgi:hypothetical protein
MIRKLLILVLLLVAYVAGVQVGHDNGFRAGVLVEHALHSPEDNP